MSTAKKEDESARDQESRVSEQPTTGSTGETTATAGESALLTEVTSLLRSLRSSGQSSEQRGPAVRVAYVKKLDPTENTSYLLDGGATHPLRQCRNRAEWNAATPTVVNPALGEATLRQKENGAFLTEEQVQPIIPVQDLTNDRGESDLGGWCVPHDAARLQVGRLHGSGLSLRWGSGRKKADGAGRRDAYKTSSVEECATPAKRGGHIRGREEFAVLLQPLPGRPAVHRWEGDWVCRLPHIKTSMEQEGTEENWRGLVSDPAPLQREEQGEMERVGVWWACGARGYCKHSGALCGCGTWGRSPQPAPHGLPGELGETRSAGYADRRAPVPYSQCGEVERRRRSKGSQRKRKRDTLGAESQYGPMSRTNATATVHCGSRCVGWPCWGRTETPRWRPWLSNRKIRRSGKRSSDRVRSLGSPPTWRGQKRGWPKRLHHCPRSGLTGHGGAWLLQADDSAHARGRDEAVGWSAGGAGHDAGLARLPQGQDEWGEDGGRMGSRALWPHQDGYQKEMGPIEMEVHRRQSKKGSTTTNGTRTGQSRGVGKWSPAGWEGSGSDVGCPLPCRSRTLPSRLCRVLGSCRKRPTQESRPASISIHVVVGPDGSVCREPWSGATVCTVWIGDGGDYSYKRRVAGGTRTTRAWGPSSTFSETCTPAVARGGCGPGRRGGRLGSSGGSLGRTTYRGWD